VVRLKRIRVKHKNGESAASTDIRAPVGIETTFEVLENGHILLPHFYLVNEDSVYVFVSLDLDPAWRGKPRPKGEYIATAWIPGNLLAEGSFFVTPGMVITAPVYMDQYWVREAVSFQVIDKMEGDSARGDWTKELRGVVRPLLQWDTDFTRTPV
jgi:lipopolysaccharide transport system ATP-binding protein